MSGTLRERTLAMAGMLQAAYLVRQAARAGRTEETPFAASLASVLATDARNTEEVYGGVHGVRKGLEILSNLLSGRDKERDLEITRYVLAIVHLERKLAKNRELFALLDAGIERAKAQAQHYGVTHDNIVASLAETYTQSISKIPPKIIVSGEHGHLTVPQNAAKVRALLLAVMRSAVLWRQKGGNRLQLMFGRGKTMGMAQALLRED